MRNVLNISLLLTLIFLSPMGLAADKKLPRSKAPKGAKVYIVSPKNGETVSSPVTVIFGLKNMGVAPAGVKQANTGHHHLIIDAPLPDSANPIPSDKHHMHFGKGQTEVSLTLAPGKHTLQLVLGDHLHIPHDPVVASEKVEITVK